MGAEIWDIIVPTVFFFLAFFAAFSLLEVLIVLFLNRLLFYYWGFTVNVVIRSRVRHGLAIRRAALILIPLLLILLFKWTAFLQIFAAASVELRIFALELFLTMILIYLLTTHRLTELSVERTIHKYLYTYTSIIAYVLIFTTAFSSYEEYKTFINANVVGFIGTIEKRLESRERQILLNEFRHSLYSGRCHDVDYTESDTHVKHFIYVTTHNDLKRTDKSFESDDDFSKYFTGRQCSNGRETFLLTDHGKWYWVIDEKKPA